MITRAGKLHVLMKDLDWLNSESLEQRKILQKTIYILKNMGIPFRYSYNWYIYGPYSTDLADDAFEIESNKDFYTEQTKRYHFNSEAKKIVDHFKELFKDRKQDVDWLELVSSLLFLKTVYEKQKNRDEIKSLLMKEKEKYTKDDVDIALDFIEKSFE